MKKIKDIGQLNRLIQFRVRADATDPLTNEKLRGSFVDDFTVYALIDWDPSSGDDESLESLKEYAENTTDFYIRYRSDVTEKHRIRFESVDYDIKSINRMDSGHRDRLLRIRAKRIDS